MVCMKTHVSYPRSPAWPHARPMTQVQTWCDGLQAKLMAAIDAAWASIEASDDPLLIRKARERMQICGQLAAAARKVAAMSGPKKPAPTGLSLPIPDTAPRGLDRLKSGRGRL